MATDWKTWFEGYANDWRDGRLQAVADRYAARFQAIKPGKSASYVNGPDMLAWLEDVQQFHLRSGLDSVEIVTTRLTPMGDTFAMVSVLWAVRFEAYRTRRIQFEISYLITGHDTDRPQIVSVISHADQRQAMRDNGVLPRELDLV